MPWFDRRPGGDTKRRTDLEIGAGVPIYLFWARQIKGIGLLLLHGFLLVLTTSVSTLTAAYLAYGDKFLD